MIDRRFDEFLRRGGPTPRFQAEPDESKFNPYHDPDDGRFTFAPGAPGPGTLPPRADRSESAGMMNRVKIPPHKSGQPRVIRRPGPPSAPPKVADHGALSARFESRAGGDPGMVSTGQGDDGGVSYGSHQLSSKTGTVASFISSQEARRWSEEFRGLTPGTSAFSAKWRVIAAREPNTFGIAQKSYIDRTHYAAAARSIAVRTGLDVGTRSEALRQVTYSATVQHGPSGGPSLVTTAIARTDKRYSRTDARYEASLINSIYDLRTAHFISKRDRQRARKQFDKADVSDNVATIRLPKERADALKILSGG